MHSSKQLRFEVLYVLLVEADGPLMLPEHHRAHEQSNSGADP